MCLIINHRNLKTARKEITVYKVLLEDSNGVLHAPYRVNTIYKQNKHYKDTKDSVITKDSKGKRTVTAGFIHSCVSKNKAQQFVKLLGERKWTPKIFKATIPIGSKYYEGTKQDICSKSIIILEEI